MPVEKDVHPYAAQRVVLRSSRPLRVVTADLDVRLNKAKAGGPVHAMLERARTREDIVRGVAGFTEGTREFVYFGGGTYSGWMDAYFDGERAFPETVAYILGNPLIAQTMLRHDILGGLHIPPRVVLQAVPGGGTRAVYDLPSSVISPAVGEQASADRAELEAAMKTLDEKLEALLREVLDDGEDAEKSAAL